MSRPKLRLWITSVPLVVLVGLALIVGTARPPTAAPYRRSRWGRRSIIA
jgi:hypothetical protein